MSSKQLEMRKGVQLLVTGTPLEELYTMGDLQLDDELLRLRELSFALRDRAIVDRQVSTLKAWARRGLPGPDGTYRILLRSTMIGQCRLSSIRWVKEFLLVHSEEYNSHE